MIFKVFLNSYFKISVLAKINIVNTLPIVIVAIGFSMFLIKKLMNKVTNLIIYNKFMT
ncbi:MAG: hypothetical protein ACRDAW_00735 [Metamycoplasmataceae bacterium]